MYYKSITSRNNLTYSIDMIRLKTYISYNKFSSIEFAFDTVYQEYVSKKYTSARMEQFFFNYNIEIEEGKSFWFGFLHNTEKRGEVTDTQGKYNFTIEFNPNKLKDNFLIKYLLNISNEWYLRSYDLAIDIKVNILDIIFDKGRKRKVQTYSNGFDDLTYRIGCSESDVKLKIYNKKIESKLDIPYDLTRIEISRKLEDFPISAIKTLKFGQENFPEIFLNNYICSLSEYQDKTLYAIVYAIQNGFPLNNLSRVYKEKIKKMFEGGSKICFSDKEATQILHQIVFAYFINNNEMRWM